MIAPSCEIGSPSPKLCVTTVNAILTRVAIGSPLPKLFEPFFWKLSSIIGWGTRMCSYDSDLLIYNTSTDHRIIDTLAKYREKTTQTSKDWQIVFSKLSNTYQIQLPPKHGTLNWLFRSPNVNAGSISLVLSWWTSGGRPPRKTGLAKVFF